MSEPVTPGKKLSGFQLDADIEQLIKDGPRRDKGKEKENGSIYFYRAKPRGSELWLLKIGRTQKHVKERLAQIKGACGHLEMEEHTKAVARDIPFHAFAEKLIHAELSNYQHQWLCDCGTRHREYFLVDEDIAVKVFERWRDFCQERPWDHDGKILPKWARRLQTNNAGRQGDGGEAASEPRETTQSAHTPLNQTYPRHAMEDDSEDDREGFATDDEDDWIRDFRSPASPDTTSKKEVFNTRESRDLHPEKKPD